MAAPFVAQRRHGDPPSVVHPADDVGHRCPRLGEEGLGEVGQTVRLLDGPQLDPVRRAVLGEHGQEDIRDSLVLGRIGVRPAQAEHHVRRGCTRGPHLLTGDHHLVAVDDAARLETREVRARIGLGEPLAVAVGSVDDAREEPLLLLVRSPHDDRGPHQPLAHSAGDAGHLGTGKLLVHHRDLDARQPAAAVLDRPRDAHVAGLGQRARPLRHSRHVLSGGDIGGHADEFLWLVRLEPFAQLGTELPRRRSQVKFERHRAPTPGWRGTRRSPGSPGPDGSCSPRAAPRRWRRVRSAPRCGRATARPSPSESRHHRCHGR